MHFFSARSQTGPRSTDASQDQNRAATKIDGLKNTLRGVNAAVEFQKRSTLLQWYDSSLRLSHCLHLSIVYIPPSRPPSLPSPQFIPQLRLATRTEAECRLFPKLIGVSLVCQETQCHYESIQSITGQWANNPSVIFDLHIHAGANGLRWAIVICPGSSNLLSPGGAQKCARDCWWRRWIATVMGSSQRAKKAPREFGSRLARQIHRVHCFNVSN